MRRTRVCGCACAFVFLVTTAMFACVGEDADTTKDVTTPDAGDAGPPNNNDGAPLLDGTAVADAAEDTSSPDGGPTSQSCKSLVMKCGSSPGNDCCATAVVPAGTFSRSYDGGRCARSP